MATFDSILNGMANAEPCNTNISLHTPSNHGVESNGQNILFLIKEAMLHSKLKGNEHRAPCKYIIILSLHTPSTLRQGQKVETFFF